MMNHHLKSYLILVIIISIASYLTIICQVKGDIDGLSSTDFFQREHSLLKPYQGSGMTVPNWEFFGSTIVTRNYIRLTQDSQSRQGGIWNTVPYQSKYWEVEVGFKVHGRGSDLYGDGFAIWYVKDPPSGGPVFGNKDYFTGLAVILDTYANYNSANSYSHPKISIMVNNGSIHYDHESDGINTEIGACDCKFRGVDWDTKILVQYYNDELSVKTDIDNTGNWVICSTIKNVHLPSHYHFGITAATGDLSDNHDILSIKMRQLSSSIQNHHPNRDDLPRADFSQGNKDRASDTSNSMSSLRKLFIIVCVFAGIIAVVGFGYFLYSSKRSSSRKRFY